MSGIITSFKADNNLPYAFYTPAAICLTDARAEIITEIYSRKRIGFHTFTPLEIYNQHTKRDYLARRELQEMVMSGLVRMVPVKDGFRRPTVMGRDRKLYRLRLTLGAIRAWEARRAIESRQ